MRFVAFTLQSFLERGECGEICPLSNPYHSFQCPHDQLSYANITGHKLTLVSKQLRVTWASSLPPLNFKKVTISSIEQTSPLAYHAAVETTKRNIYESTTVYGLFSSSFCSFPLLSCNTETPAKTGKLFTQLCCKPNWGMDSHEK